MENIKRGNEQAMQLAANNSMYLGGRRYLDATVLVTSSGCGSLPELEMLECKKCALAWRQ